MCIRDRINTHQFTLIELCFSYRITSIPSGLPYAAKALGFTVIQRYPFFFYKPDEALHLSLREKSKIVDCLHNIGDELEPVSYTHLKHTDT